MLLELRPMAKEDAQEASKLVVASYENNPFRTLVFPIGMSQVSLDRMVERRQKAIDDANKHVLKVVDTDNNDRMAGFAAWEYTKAMTDEDWKRAKEEAQDAYPEARHDILDDFIFREQDAKRRTMNHTRWFGGFTPASRIAP